MTTFFSLYFLFQFVAVEGFLTPILDIFPNVLYKRRNRTLAVAGYCCLCFVIGLCFVTQVCICIMTQTVAVVYIIVINM